MIILKNEAKPAPAQKRERETIFTAPGQAAENGSVVWEVGSGITATDAEVAEVCRRLGVKGFPKARLIEIKGLLARYTIGQAAIKSRYSRSYLEKVSAAVNYCKVAKNAHK